MNCKLSRTTCSTSWTYAANSIASMTSSTSVAAWKRMKCKGNRSKSSQSSLSAVASPGRPSRCRAFCLSILMASAEFLTSNDPQSVGAPASSKSMEICDASVVFPAPLGPVSSVSSPGRAPLIKFVNFGNDGSGAPTYRSGCRSSWRTWPRSCANDTRPSWSGRAASSSARATSDASLRNASFASLSASGPRTRTQRCRPSFRANFSAPSTPASSSSIQRKIRLNRSKSGKTAGGSDAAPLGSETAGRPVAWKTAMASYSPSVSTTSFASSGTAWRPKSPHSPPAGSTRMWRFVATDRIFRRTVAAAPFSGTSSHGNVAHGSSVQPASSTRKRRVAAPTP
mmetsp:Transcript_9416/g.29276  ORF Transcript_9416/g.29276 Transcript_9416/m.29276 type:complete len:340 (+) Transcript_9416:403-1422(+)